MYLCIYIYIYTCMYMYVCIYIYILMGSHARFASSLAGRRHNKDLRLQPPRLAAREVLEEAAAGEVGARRQPLLPLDGLAPGSIQSGPLRGM